MRAFEGCAPATTKLEEEEDGLLLLLAFRLSQLMLAEAEKEMELVPRCLIKLVKQSAREGAADRMEGNHSAAGAERAMRRRVAMETRAMMVLVVMVIILAGGFFLVLV